MISVPPKNLALTATLNQTNEKRHIIYFITTAIVNATYYNH